MIPFTWIDTSTVASALQAGRARGTEFKAGGVDLLDRIKEGIDAPRAVVNLRGLGQELAYVRVGGDAIALGPLVTLAQLAEDPQLLKEARALALAAGGAATPQVRNAATLGGNLAQRPRCWYFRNVGFECLRRGGARCSAQEGEHELHAVFDNDRCAMVHPSATGAALLALDATLTLRTEEAERVVPMDEFFISPKQNVTKENVLRHGELIVDVKVPRGWRSGYQKVMQKQSFDWPIVECAVAVRLDGTTVKGARVVLGHVAPRPLRIKAAEQALTGGPLSAERIAAAAKAATTGATPLARNGYKLKVIEAAVTDALTQLQEGA